MDLEKAKGPLAQGGWTELSVPMLSYFVLKPTPKQVSPRFAFNGKCADHALGFFA
jgi:hypothetical protein